MNLLENIDSPADVRKLARHQLTPLAHELRHAKPLEARSILEWRLRPARLDAALATFLDEVWA